MSRRKARWSVATYPVSEGGRSLWVSLIKKNGKLIQKIEQAGRRNDAQQAAIEALELLRNDEPSL